jgi:hypothetical protein
MEHRTGPLLRRAALVAGLAISAAAGVVGFAGGAGASARAGSDASAATSLAIHEAGGLAGSIRYSLTCDPAGGTLPHPGRVCRALASHPELLTPVAPGNPFPCPFGQPSFAISGRHAGRAVDVAYTACTSGQGPIASRWRALVPSDDARLTVKPGRAIGLWHLGARESLIRAELGAGHPAGPPCSTCRRTYSLGAGRVATTDNHFFTITLKVAYRSHRVAALEANAPWTIVGGLRLQAGERALERRLASWTRTVCPSGDVQLQRGHGSSTIVEFARYVTRVVVQRGAPRCL